MSDKAAKRLANAIFVCGLCIMIGLIISKPYNPSLPSLYPIQNGLEDLAKSIEKLKPNETTK